VKGGVHQMGEALERVGAGCVCACHRIFLRKSMMYSDISR
jgi:hypothetical protein